LFIRIKHAGQALSTIPFPANNEHNKPDSRRLNDLAERPRRSISIPANAAPGQDGLLTLGARVRSGREALGISLREFARRLKVSPSLISQIERGRAMPSVGTLYSIANELDLSFDDMFNPAEHASERIDPATPLQGVEPQDGRVVQRGQDRKVIRLAGGVQWERLTPQHDEQVEFLHVTYEVGASSCPPDSLIRHPGREYAYVLSGRLGIQVGFEEYELLPGDSSSFSAQTPHRIWTIGNEPVHAIWVICNRYAR
jgi:transcriptional regulator with XRE-family HTH domain